MKNINIKINPSRLRDGLLVLLLITTFGLAPSNSQTLKIGYVNSAKILQELPEAQEAQKKLDAMGKGWQDELEKMTKNLQTKYEEYQKKQGMMNEQAKLATQQDLVELEQKVYQYRTEKFGSDGELAKQSDKLLSPIKDKVLKVIQQVAKEEKVSFIFDRNEQIMVLLYGDPTYDYTFKVIDKLKRSK
ncbi:MAG: OmpH family outer membrane protein [Bacteroidota bacterium]|nr:OmpH family outer membrane protein [Bacteroidota bacterium]